MNNNEELLRLISQTEDESLNIKKFLHKLLTHWYWFLITGVIGLSGAYFVNKYTPPSYSTSSLVLVKEKESGGMNMDNLFDNFQFNSNVKLENHIGILTSFSLNRQVVENLGWHVSWYQKMPLGDYNLYGKEPYKIEFNNSDNNQKGVPLHVSPLENGKFLINVDATAQINGEDIQLIFEQPGEFGTEFKNKYFSFVLYQTGIETDGDYYFCFNNLDHLALSFQKRIQISAVNKNADLVSLTLLGQSPLQNIRFLNELTKVYIEFGLDEKNLTSKNTIRFIDQQLVDIVNELKVTSNDFSNYRVNNNVFDLGQKASLVVEKLVELDSKKSLAEMQLNYYENLNSYLDNAEKMKKLISPSVVGITDASLINLVSGLAALYSKKETLSYSLHDKNPSIQMIANEIEYTKNSLNENLKNLVYNTKQQLESLQMQISEMNEQVANYPKTEQDLINIKRMFDLNNELYTFLLQKRAEAEITKASNIPDIKVLDAANKATFIKTGPKKQLNLIIGIFIGLIVPFLVIIIRDFFDETIHNKEDIQKLTKIPVVATIAHNPYNEGIPSLKYPRSVIAESLRELRTKLDSLCPGKAPIVVGVHSVVPQEGKSFISANLASIIAVNNKRVILIDGDMRKPTLHKFLENDNEEGLSTYLIGHHNLDQVIKSTFVKNLDFISSGLIPPNPAELLGTKEFDVLMEELKNHYDVIVIDNPPISLVTDGIIVGRHTNIDLFVCREGYSDKKLIDFVDQLTEKDNFKKSGIVLNDMNSRNYNGYSYRYGGYYGKAYGASKAYFEDEKNKKHKKKS